MAVSYPVILDEQERISYIEYTETLGDKITLLAAQINAATYRFLKLIAEFDKRGGWVGAGIRSLADWLNLQCGIANCAARERVRVARCLEGKLPLINEAFEKGEVSYSKVRAMTRVATDKNEDYLLMIAQNGTASHIEKLVRKYEKVEKKLDRDEQESLHESRELTYMQDDNGMWIIKAKLPQDEGALFIKAIDEIMDKQDKPLKEIPGQLIKNVSAETADEPEMEIKETCNFGQKRADALSAMTEHYIASNSDDELKTLAGHERCQVVLHLDVDTLKHLHKHEDGDNCDCEFDHQSQYMDNQWITPENAKRFSCDASILTVLEDKDGNVLNVGRKTRTVPPTLKRALDIRDTTCRFPGCTCSKYVDFHHVKHWAKGGETSKGNLIKLCRFHHRALHQGLYTIETLGDKNNPQFIFKNQQGKVMEQNPDLPHTNDTTVEGAVEYFALLWPHMMPRTGRTKWDGESMDYHTAVDSLCYRRFGSWSFMDNPKLYILK